MSDEDDPKTSEFIRLLSSPEAAEKLSEYASRYIRGRLKAESDLRFNFPGLRYAISPLGETDEQRAEREAEEAALAEEYRYAVYPLPCERDRCYTCGGPTHRQHKCRWCRGAW